jgi:hypothetical protein
MRRAVRSAAESGRPGTWGGWLQGASPKRRWTALASASTLHSCGQPGCAERRFRRGCGQRLGLDPLTYRELPLRERATTVAFGRYVRSFGIQDRQLMVAVEIPMRGNSDTRIRTR